MMLKKILLFGLIIITILAALIWVAWIQLRGEHTNTLTFEGTVHQSTFKQAPNNIHYVEVYHDGEALVLVTIEHILKGSTSYPVGSTVGLILKDYEQFGGSGFRAGRYRITLDKYVQDDNFEYWRCSAKRMSGG